VEQNTWGFSQTHRLPSRAKNMNECLQLVRISEDAMKTPKALTFPLMTVSSLTCHGHLVGVAGAFGMLDIRKPPAKR
jgi:L-serine deaminase